LRLGRAAGVEIVADWSLLVILALIAVALGTGMFAAWSTSWGAATSWLLALLAAASFAAAVAIHELAHAVVANRNSVEVQRITLFMFGGMTSMEGEPPSPGAELRIALAGPLMSLLVGVVATLVGVLLAHPVLTLDQPLAWRIEALSPAAVLLLWFGPMNLLLAAFNLIPGFPMDGGRILRALLWKATGNLDRATWWASRAGQVVAWAFVAIGLLMLFGFYLPFFGGGLVAGVWLMLIGVFLASAARMSYRERLLHRALDDLPVKALMRTQCDAVSPDATLQDLVDQRFAHSDMDALPVVDHDRLVGMVDVEAVRRIGRERWKLVEVTDAMVPVNELRSMAPDDPAIAALRRLEVNDPIPVVEDGDRMVGIVRARDLVRWVSLHSDAAAPG